MPRRDPASASGFVNFPATDPAYKHTEEGGMFVRLSVLAPDPAGKWMHCSGGVHTMVIDACPIGKPTEAALFPKLAARQARIEAAPPDADTELPTDEELESAELLANLTIGSTGWSGWHEAVDKLWECTEADLTEDGQALLALMRRLYPGCTIVISTWLDT